MLLVSILRIQGAIKRVLIRTGGTPILRSGTSVFVRHVTLKYADLLQSASYLLLAGDYVTFNSKPKVSRAVIKFVAICVSLTCLGCNQHTVALRIIEVHKALHHDKFVDCGARGHGVVIRESVIRV